MAQHSLLKACCSNFVVFATLAFAMMGCTRNPLAPTDGKVTIALPSAQSLSASNQKYMKSIGKAKTATTAATSQVQVLIVNITGAGISTPVYFNWSAHSPGDVPPTAITLTVPQGSARQVQVFVAAQTSSGMVLDFGSTTMDLTDPSMAVDIALAPIGTSSGIQGRIAGRYFAAGGTKPTGTVNIFLTPTAGASPILIQQTEIFDGFFDFFGITDVPFTYAMADGTVLFQPNLTLATGSSNPLVASNMSYPSSYAVAYVPPVYKTYDNNPNPQANLIYFGYFGPGLSIASAATTLSACSDPAGIVSSVFTDSAKTASLGWVTSGTSLGALTSSTPQKAGIFQGSHSQTCTGTAFTNYMHLPINNVASQDQAIGFRGPFQAEANGSFLTLTNDGSGNLSVNWAYLPGIQSDAVLDGADVFFAPFTLFTGGGEPYKDSGGNGFACDQLAALGFSKLASTTIASSSAVIPGHTMADNLEVIVCPYKANLMGIMGNTYFHSGVDSGNSGGGGGGSGSGPMLGMVLTKNPVASGVVVPATETIGLNQSCTAFYVQSVDMTGTAVNLPNVASLNVMVNSTLPAGTALFSDAGCTTGVSALSIPSGTAKSSPFFIASASTTGVYQITIQDGSNQMMPAFVNFATASTMTPNATTFQMVGPANLASGPNQCYPVQLQFNSSGVPTIVSNATVTYTTTGGTLHQKPDCSDTGNTLNVVNEHGAVLYYDPPVVTAATTFTLAAASSNPTLASSTTVVTVGTTTPSKLLVNLQGGVAQNCSPLYLGLGNEIGAQLNNVTASYPASLSVPTGASLFTTSDCSGSAYATLGVTLGGGSSTQYYVAGVGSTVVTLSGSGLTTGTSGTIVFPAPFGFGLALPATTTQCSLITTGITTPGGVMLAGASTTFTGTLSASPGLLYTSNTCTGTGYSLASVNVGAGASVYYLGGSGSQTVTLIGTGASSSMHSSSLTTSLPSGYVPGAAYQVIARKTGFPTNGFAVNTCGVLEIAIADANGIPTTGPATSVGLFVNGVANPNISVNATDCGPTGMTVANTSVNLPGTTAGWTKVYYWVPTAANSSFGSSTLCTSVVGGGGGTVGGGCVNHTYGSVDWPGYFAVSSDYSFDVGMPQNPVPGICYPVPVMAKTIGGAPAYIASAFTPTITSSGAVQAYSDSACTTAISVGISMASASPAPSVGVFYMKASATGTPFGKFTINWDSPHMSPSFHPAQVNVWVGSGTTTPTTLSILSMPQSLFGNTCSATPLVVGLQNSAGSPVVATSAVTLTPSASIFLYYSDPGCTVSVSPASTGIPAGQSAVSYFVKPVTTGGTMYFTSAGGATLTSNAPSFVVNSACGTYQLAATTNASVSSDKCTVTMTGQTIGAVGGAYSQTAINGAHQKTYFEYVVANEDAAGTLTVGFGDTYYNSVTGLGSSFSPAFGTSTDGMKVTTGGGNPAAIYGGSSYALPAAGINGINPGDVIGIALNYTTGDIWVSVNGVWQGSGSVGGVFNPSMPLIGTSALKSITMQPVIQFTEGNPSWTNQVTMISKQSQLRHFDAFVAAAGFVGLEP